MEDLNLTDLAGPTESQPAIQTIRGFRTHPIISKPRDVLGINVVDPKPSAALDFCDADMRLADWSAAAPATQELL